MTPRQLLWLTDLACRDHVELDNGAVVWASLATFDSTASMDLTGLALPQASHSPQPSAGVPPPSSGSAARLPALPGMRLVRYRAACRAWPPLEGCPEAEGPEVPIQIAQAATGASLPPQQRGDDGRMTAATNGSAQRRVVSPCMTLLLWLQHGLPR